MKKNMMPSNGHRIHGFSSETFIDARDIIKRLDLKGNEVFMDAGCGDGHIAIKALNDYLPDGMVTSYNAPNSSDDSSENSYGNSETRKNCLNTHPRLP